MCARKRMRQRKSARESDITNDRERALARARGQKAERKRMKAREWEHARAGGRAVERWVVLYREERDIQGMPSEKCREKGVYLWVSHVLMRGCV